MDNAAFMLISCAVTLLPLFLGMKYTSPSNLREDWRIESNQDKIVFQNPPNNQIENGAFAAWIWLQPLPWLFVVFGWSASTPQISSWGVFTLFTLCAFAIGSAVAEQSGLKQLEIDLKQHTYRYFHRPMFKLPSKSRRGSLEDFACVDVNFGNNSSRVSLKLKRDSSAGSEYTIGLFLNSFRALEIANEIGTKLGVEVKISRGKLILPPKTAEQNVKTGKYVDAVGIIVWSGRESTRVDLRFKQPDRRERLGMFSNRLQAVEMAKHTAEEMGLPLLVHGSLTSSTTPPIVKVRTVTPSVRK